MVLQTEQCEKEDTKSKSAHAQEVKCALATCTCTHTSIYTFVPTHLCTHMHPHAHPHTHHTCNTHTHTHTHAHAHTHYSGRKADWKLPSKKVHWAEYELVWCSQRPYQGCWNCQQRSPLDNPGSAQLSKEILKMIHLFHDDVISHFISSKELSPYLRS